MQSLLHHDYIQTHTERLQTVYKRRFLFPKRPRPDRGYCLRWRFSIFWRKKVRIQIQQGNPQAKPQGRPLVGWLSPKRDDEVKNDNAHCSVPRHQSSLIRLGLASDAVLHQHGVISQQTSVLIVPLMPFYSPSTSASLLSTNTSTHAPFTPPPTHLLTHPKLSIFFKKSKQ